MPKRVSKISGSELFIVDNSDDEWKVLRYLHDWCELSNSIDIATAYFEIGSLLALKDEWQKVGQIRILMGDEVSARTKKAFERALAKINSRLDQSIETSKEQNAFLDGVPAIVEALRSGKILCRVFREDKFHAKAYITHARLEVVGSSALVGSSNFTAPGLTENIELNVQIAGTPVAVLQEWFEEHWALAEDVTPDILETVERHIKPYEPFLVYAKSLQEFFRGHEMTAGEWELAGPLAGGSCLYPRLDQYQRDGYQALLKIARKYRGAFLCDGVGLGKTFVGMMVLERLVVHERKRVALLVPKAAREAVWETSLKRYLPNVSRRDFSNLVIFNHTDLQREGEFQERLDYVKQAADAIIIDEAHHFRNPGIKGTGERRPSRYRRLFEIADGKEMYLLTATPVNNRLIDLQHMIELFSRQQTDYFKEAPLGIHSLAGHFRRMEKELERAILGHEVGTEADTGIETNESEAREVLSSDPLVQALVVQRSRAYVKKSQEQHGGRDAIFPTREAPKVVSYSVKKTFGRLLETLERAFEKANPLFSLAIYYPLAYYKGPDSSIDPLSEGRQKQVVSLIRTQFLKRFESSAESFSSSCQTLLLKLLTFITKHADTSTEKRLLERWRRQHEKLLLWVQEQQRRWASIDEEDADEDLISDEMLEAAEKLSRDEYRVEDIIAESYLDLDQLAEFLNELMKFEPKNDDKLKALITLLKTDSVMKKHKVLIFTEYMTTARYLLHQLRSNGIVGVEEVDSSYGRDREDVITRFAPYYNESSSSELKNARLSEIRVLISTDVLSEGLNLQDATRLINYDLHWNPVRLMQRIGRVDRRMNPDFEARLVADHPDQKSLRGKVAYWNFLPPDELDELLRLYSRITGKALRISKTFGIEGKKLLTPKDNFDALKDFNHAYEGSTTFLEELHLEFERLLRDQPDLAGRLALLPGRVFSGKRHPAPDTRAVFFCFCLPGRTTSAVTAHVEREADLWTEEGGTTGWYLFDLAASKIVEDAAQIVDIIRCKPDTPRHCIIDQTELAAIRGKIENHIKNTYLRKVQAPVGVKPILKAWMELN